MNIFAGHADWLAAAIHSESHPEIRRVLALNAWKIRDWSDYASWKNHSKKWVAISWKYKCRDVTLQALRALRDL